MSRRYEGADYLKRIYINCFLNHVDELEITMKEIGKTLKEKNEILRDIKNELKSIKFEL